MRIMAADELDGSRGAVQVYQMSIMPYGDVFVGLLCLLHIQATTPTDAGYLDIQLAVSRDGRNWIRPGNRELFIPRGSPGEWDDQEVPAMQSWVIKDDRIYFYYPWACRSWWRVLRPFACASDCEGTPGCSPFRWHELFRPCVSASPISTFS